jgi:hypothetical protein
LKLPQQLRKPWLLVVVALVLVAVGVTVGIAINGRSQPSVQQNTSQVNGEPTLSLAVPIMASACTLSDTCIVLGSSSGTGTGATLGEVAHQSIWQTLSLPDSKTATFQGSSCWKNGCFIFGSTIDGDLLWRFNAKSNAVTSLTPPTPSPAVEAVSCFAVKSCSVIDMGGRSSAPQFYSTSDAGTTWSTPISIPFDATGLACTSLERCVATSSSAAWRTFDGGSSWKQSSAIGGTLQNLFCSKEVCVANDTNTAHDHVWRSTDFGKTWSSTLLTDRTFAFACLDVNHCVAAGQTKDSTGAVTNVVDGGLSELTVNYFPNPITTLACGKSRCVAGGLYSVALFKP